MPSGEAEERFSIEPVLAVTGRRWRPNSEGAMNSAQDVGRAAQVLGIDANTVRKWRDEGMSERQADRVAMLLGLHPGELWPDQWFAVA